MDTQAFFSSVKESEQFPRLRFWLMHDTWTHQQAALLLCGLNPEHSELSDNGCLLGTQALQLDGSWTYASRIVYWPQVEVTEQMHTFLTKQSKERDRLEAIWRALSQDVHDCYCWIMAASTLTNPATPYEYISWSKSKGLGGLIHAVMGDTSNLENDSVVMGQVDSHGESLAASELSAEPVGPADKAQVQSDPLSNLAALFDPVKVEHLETLFPDENRWKTYADKASRNGLIKSQIKKGVRQYNLYLAAEWWIFKNGKSQKGWSWERCLKTLKKNLPSRSRSQSYLLDPIDYK